MAWAWVVVVHRGRGLLDVIISCLARIADKLSIDTARPPPFCLLITTRHNWTRLGYSPGPRLWKGLKISRLVWFCRWHFHISASRRSVGSKHTRHNPASSPWKHQHDSFFQFFPYLYVQPWHAVVVEPDSEYCYFSLHHESWL